MTEREIDRIAGRVAEKMAAQQHDCPLGLDHATAEQLKDLAATWKKSRAAMVMGIVGLLCAVAVGIFGLGVVAKIREVSQP